MAHDHLVAPAFGALPRHFAAAHAECHGARLPRGLPPRTMGDDARLAERRARLQRLQVKMNESASANRQEVAEEQASRREHAQKRSVGQARKLAKAERILDERDLREAGKDVERHRAMHYTIEENEAWEAKLEDKERTRDKGAIGTSFASPRFPRPRRALLPSADCAPQARRGCIRKAEGVGYRAAPVGVGAACTHPRKRGAGAQSRCRVRRTPPRRRRGRPAGVAPESRVRRTSHADKTRSGGAAGGATMGQMPRLPTSTKRTSTSTRRSSAYVALLTQYYDEHTKEIRENRTFPHPDPQSSAAPPCSSDCMYSRAIPLPRLHVASGGGSWRVRRRRKRAWCSRSGAACAARGSPASVRRAC